eukprot:5669799-Pyramimonas_sp.AAC.1
MEERAIRLYGRVLADPRYVEAREVLALAEQAAGSWVQHVRQLLVRWHLPDPPGPQAGVGARAQYRRQVRAAAHAQEHSWRADPAQRDALARAAGAGPTALQHSAAGASLPEVRAWARLCLQGAL